MRLTPYTELGIRRCRCFRCGAPAEYQWSICADGNVYRPVCARCDIDLNRLVLRWARDPDWREKLAAYRRHVMAKKKPAKKAPAKAGKKPSRGVVKKAPVRVKPAKPKPRTVALNAPQVLHVPDGDLSKAEAPRPTVREGWEQVKELGARHVDLAERALASDSCEAEIRRAPRRGLFRRLIDRLFGA